MFYEPFLFQILLLLMHIQEMINYQWGTRAGEGCVAVEGPLICSLWRISGELVVILQCSSTNLSRCGETNGADQDSLYRGANRLGEGTNPKNMKLRELWSLRGPAQNYVYKDPQLQSTPPPRLTAASF